MKNVEFFLFENFPFLVLKFSIYLNRRVFLMKFDCILILYTVIRLDWLQSPLTKS